MNYSPGTICFALRWKLLALWTNSHVLSYEAMRLLDYAKIHKNDIWQGYAAGTAAAYVKELLDVVLESGGRGNNIRSISHLYLL